MPNDRYEIKYILTRDAAREFLRRASSRMRPDPHAGEGGRYSVRSLYYDTPDLRHYREVIDGERLRRKYRLRRYGPDGGQFFEVKARLNRSILKRRARASGEEVLALLRDPFNSPLAEAIGDHAAELARFPHQPVLTICYDRIALEDLLGAELRATLDLSVRCGGPDLFERPVKLDDPRVLPPGLAVLELKFRGKLPGWLLRAIVELELTARDYSKYAQGVRRVIEKAPLIPEIATAS